MIFYGGKHYERLHEVTNRLNGKKILVRGNHDFFSDEEYLNAGFSRVCNLLEINILRI